MCPCFGTQGPTAWLMYAGTPQHLACHSQSTKYAKHPKIWQHSPPPVGGSVENKNGHVGGSLKVERNVLQRPKILQRWLDLLYFFEEKPGERDSQCHTRPGFYSKKYG